MSKAAKIALINFKGGVAKTTTSVNLAATLAKRGYNTLLVDLDPQCNTTQWLLGSKRTDKIFAGIPTVEKLNELNLSEYASIVQGGKA